ncbi:MAG: DUF169 domain-containing protein [Candidatus Hodarchaeota archaeon]
MNPGGDALSNKEIAHVFQKYGKLKHKPIAMYYTNVLPSGKVRHQRTIIGRCIPPFAFKASRKGGTSLLEAGRGCPGGLWWAGFSKVAPKGLANFLAHGREGSFGDRAEHFKRNVKLAAGVFKAPGPVEQPPGNKYISFQRLEDIPDDVKIEFVLFFTNPLGIARLVTLCHYGHPEHSIVRAPGGSGCMSVLNHPLQLKPAPEPDAVMGIWDLFARKSMPRNILSLAVRRWFAEEMAKDIPSSFMNQLAPFTTKGELTLLFKKLRRKIQQRKEK